MRFSPAQSILFCVYLSTVIKKKLQTYKQNGVYISIMHCICRLTVSAKIHAKSSQQEATKDIEQINKEPAIIHTPKQVTV